MNVIKGEIFYAKYSEDFPCKIDSQNKYIQFVDIYGNKVTAPVDTIIALYNKIQENNISKKD